VFACAEGTRTRAQITGDLGCNPVTVSKWRNRFAADRLDGLIDAPRPGASCCQQRAMRMYALGSTGRFDVCVHDTFHGRVAGPTPPPADGTSRTRSAPSTPSVSTEGSMLTSSRVATCSSSQPMLANGHWVVGSNLRKRVQVEPMIPEHFADDGRDVRDSASTAR
jgi:hypothetical protein